VHLRGTRPRVTASPETWCAEAYRNREVLGGLSVSARKALMGDVASPRENRRNVRGEHAAFHRTWYFAPDVQRRLVFRWCFPPVPEPAPFIPIALLPLAPSHFTIWKETRRGETHVRRLPLGLGLLKLRVPLYQNHPGGPGGAERLGAASRGADPRRPPLPRRGRHPALPPSPSPPSPNPGQAAERREARSAGASRKEMAETGGVGSARCPPRPP